jgi:hypothetical protein
MFISTFSRRRANRPFGRRSRTRRPLVESFEGRKLLSAVAFIQGQHIGASAIAPSDSLSFTKIELTGVIQGNHIGTSVSSAAPANVSTAGADTVRFYEYN